jgi:hypothetical protein
MGFCEPNEYLEFMRQTPDFERMLVRSGIQLYKYWFSVTQEEQRRRFASRERDPLKRWKLSPVDKASLDKWDDYTEAKEAMFFYTDTADAPWTVIKSDDKKRARLNCMLHFLSTLDYPDKDLRIAHAPDPLIVGQAGHVIHRAQHILGSSLHPETRRVKSAVSEVIPSGGLPTGPPSARRDPRRPTTKTRGVLRHGFFWFAVSVRAALIVITFVVDRRHRIRRGRNNAPAPRHRRCCADRRRRLRRRVHPVLPR